MLVPSFACDQTQPSTAAPPAQHSSLHPTVPAAGAAAVGIGLGGGLLLASPPASPPQMSAPNALGNLFTTCRNLQALLAAPSPSSLSSLPLLPPLPSSAATHGPITPPQHHHHQLQLQLPTPPLAHAPSPMKLRLRSRKVASLALPTAATPDSDSTSTRPEVVARKRIVKRTAPPRGSNKRRRAVDDDTGRGADGDDGTDSDDGDGNNVNNANNASDDRESLLTSTPNLAPSLFSLPSTTTTSTSTSPFVSASSSPFAGAVLALPPLLKPQTAQRAQPEVPLSQSTLQEASLQNASESAPATAPTTPPRPQTPKRARIAPLALPMGLERGDYHALHADGVPDDSSSSNNNNNNNNPADVEVEADGETWSTEEDRMLVELVLEKLKLSKTDWQDCARSLGKKDRHSLGRRWKSLMLHGDIGLVKPAGAGAGPRGVHRRGKIHGTWR